MHSKLYIPARSAELPYTVDITPESAGLDRVLLAGSRTPQRGQQRRTAHRPQRSDDPATGGWRNRRMRRRDVRVGAPRFGFRRPRGHGLPRHRPALPHHRRGPVRDLRREGERSFPNRRVAAADVAVELRGAGNCSRQVHNFGTAGVFEADSLIACEVITPAATGRATPRTSTTRTPPTESELEEIYYFEIAPRAQD